MKDTGIVSVIFEVAYVSCEFEGDSFFGKLTMAVTEREERSERIASCRCEKV
jgi:hypothetical protein